MRKYMCLPLLVLIDLIYTIENPHLESEPNSCIYKLSSSLLY